MVQKKKLLHVKWTHRGQKKKVMFAGMREGGDKKWLIKWQRLVQGCTMTPYDSWDRLRQTLVILSSGRSGYGEGMDEFWLLTLSVNAPGGGTVALVNGMGFYFYLPQKCSANVLPLQIRYVLAFSPRDPEFKTHVMKQVSCNGLPKYLNLTLRNTVCAFFSVQQMDALSKLMLSFTVGLHKVCLPDKGAYWSAVFIS